MDFSPTALIRLLLPQVPSILTTLILNKLSLSANSDKQDAKTEVVVSIIRHLMRTRKPMKVVQAGSLKGPLKGKMWIAKTAVPAPDAHVRDVVVRGIKELGNGSEQFTLPDICDVEGEWTGHRDVADKNAPRLEIPEKDQYDRLLKETTSDVTILYLHGGAYFLMDPASHRLTVSALAKRTGGKAFSVRYRLAPQHPFPAALLDALTAYLYLLSPPPGSFHEAVPASKIVFSGDSAGGNLSTALCLLLLTLQNAGVKSIPFHGQDVPLQLPAGVALNSPWCDITRSLPSIHDNAKYDYIDPPSATGIPTPMTPDEIWPAKPPRAEIFCQASAMIHPLVSPVIADSELWKGAPPFFFCAGDEGLLDEINVMARNLYLAGTSVEFVHYTGMPHCFAMIFPSTEPAKDCFSRWGAFCVSAAKGCVERKDTGISMKAFSNPLQFTDIDLRNMGISDSEVKSKMQQVKDRAEEREQAEIKKWQQESRAKL